MKTSTFVSLLCIVFLSFSSISCSTSSNILSSKSPLIAALENVPQLSEFTKLLKTKGLNKALGDLLNSPFTLLAPTDEAFSGMGSEALNNLGDPSNIDKLVELVKNHIIPGKLDPGDLMNPGVKTAAGTELNLGNAQLGQQISNPKFNIIPVNRRLG